MQNLKPKIPFQGPEVKSSKYHRIIFIISFESPIQMISALTSQNLKEV